MYVLKRPAKETSKKDLREKPTNSLSNLMGKLVPLSALLAA